jgi:hypothetical protein
MPSVRRLTTGRSSHGSLVAPGEFGRRNVVDRRGAHFQGAECHQKALILAHQGGDRIWRGGAMSMWMLLRVGLVRILPNGCDSVIIHVNMNVTDAINASWRVNVSQQPRNEEHKS